MRLTKNHTDSGAAAVEFALVAMILVMILFGTIEFGRFWMIQSSLSQIAREGAREMAIHGDDPITHAAIEESMRDRTEALNLGSSVAVEPTVEAEGGGPCAADKTAVATITAKSVTTMTGISFWGAIDLTGKAEMRCGG